MARSAKPKKIIASDSVVLTAKGYAELQAELEERLRLRDTIAEEIRESKDLGDLSENASYHEAMERKDLNENRIEEVESLLARATVADQDQHHSVITIGRSVEITRVGGKSKKVVHLVGSTEADPLKDKISIESPLGKVLLNAKIGDTVVVKLPQEEVSYKVSRFVD